MPISPALRSTLFQPCLPHEVKYDGRLILQRDGARVRLITRNGHDRERAKQFVIDGEAVILDVDGIADFNALNSRQHDGTSDGDVQLYAFDVLAPDSAAQDQPRAAATRPTDGIFVAPFEQDEIGPDLFRAACNVGLEGMVSKRADRPLSCRLVEGLDQGQESQASGDVSGEGRILIKPGAMVMKADATRTVKFAFIPDRPH